MVADISGLCHYVNETCIEVTNHHSVSFGGIILHVLANVMSTV